MDKKKLIIVIALTAFIGGLLFALFSYPRTQEIVPSEENENEVMDYTSRRNSNETNDEEIEKNTEKQEEVEESEEDVPGELDGNENYYERPEAQPVDESELSTSYSELIGEKTVKETKEFTNDFIEIYYNFDGDDPTRFIEEVKEYMTEDLYERLIETPETPTHYHFKRNYIESEIEESKAFQEKSDEIIPYIVYVDGEVIDVLGEEKQEIRDVYRIILMKDGDEYKVSDIFKNQIIEYK